MKSYTLLFGILLAGALLLAPFAGGQCEVSGLAFTHQASFANETVLGVRESAFRASGDTNFIVGESGGQLILIKPKDVLRGEVDVDFAFQLTNRYCFGADVAINFPAGRKMGAGIKVFDEESSIQAYFISPQTVYVTDCGPEARCGNAVGCNCGGGKGVVSQRLWVQRNGPEVKISGVTSSGTVPLWQRNMLGPVHVRMFMLTEADVTEQASASFTNVSVIADGVLSSVGPPLLISKAVKVVVNSTFDSFFEVERSSSVDSGQWNPWVGPILGTGEPIALWDDDDGTSRFYRSRTLVK
jgi:hypothetical protein